MTLLRGAGAYAPWDRIALGSQLTHLSALTSLEEMRRSLRTPKSRHRFLERLRFPHGFRCLACGDHAEPGRPRPGVLTCAACNHLHELRAGTLFEDDGISLGGWFDVFWMLASGQRVLDVGALQRLLALRDPRAAEQALRGLRRAIAHAERAPLSGRVEIDARVLDLGSVHAIVLAAVECHGFGSGRVQLERAANLGAEVVRRFIERHVTPGSTIRTDCWSNYLDLDGGGYRHEIDEQISMRMRRIDALCSALRGWLRTEEALREEALGGHLDEFVLRFNRCSQARPGELFCQLLAEALDPACRGARRSKRMMASGVRRIEGSEPGESQEPASARSHRAASGRRLGRRSAG